MPHPHLLLCRILALLKEQGMDISEARAVQIACRLFDCSDWDALLSRWWEPGAIQPDNQLTRGVLAARRSRQISVLAEAGLPYPAAVAAIYKLRPTDDGGETLPARVPETGFIVRDGSYVRITRQSDHHLLDFGLGRLSDGSLRVMSSLSTRRIKDGWDEASELGIAMLTKAVDDLRASFREGRAVFRGYDGVPIRTTFGGMDVVEIITTGVLRASASDSSDPGCYILSDAAARKMPPFSIMERHSEGFSVVAADGIGLMVPLMFRKAFTSAEITSAEEALETEYPMTYRMLKGEIATSLANFNVASQEWNEDHDPGNVPQYIVIDEIRESRTDRYAVMLTVKTDDILSKVSTPDGHLFVVPVEEVGDDLVIDPERHRPLRPAGMSVKVFRDND